MTSDELNRTIEFIIQSQARLAAGQEQDRLDYIKFQEWSTHLYAEMAKDRQRLAELLEIQSRRLDRAEKEDAAAHQRLEQLRYHSDQRFEELLRELRAGFDRIVQKLAAE